MLVQGLSNCSSNANAQELLGAIQGADWSVANLPGIAGISPPGGAYIDSYYAECDTCVVMQIMLHEATHQLGPNKKAKGWGFGWLYELNWWAFHDMAYGPKHSPSDALVEQILEDCFPTCSSFYGEDGPSAPSSGGLYVDRPLKVR